MAEIPPGEIVIIGGGIAGLSAAWNLLKSGYSVRIIEKSTCGQGSSRIAAGMLAPIHELEFTELDILQAGLESIRLYAEWEKELGDIGLDRTGTLEIASGQEDIPYLKRQFEFQQQQGLEVHWLDQAALKEKEPMLSGTVPCGIYAPGDIQVENRLVLEALKQKILLLGGVIQEHTQFESWDEAEQLVWVQNAHQERQVIPASALIFALGACPKPLPSHPEIIPVKGEMIALEKKDSFPLKHIIRIRNRRLGNAYVVPKRFTILAGSTSEHMGYIQGNTFGGLLDILRKCYQVLPGLYELNIQEIYSGLRPASDDHLPQIMKIGPGPVYCLNGLYRHGILLGPWAGKKLSDMVEGK
jgi:glycine oxidase